MDTFPDSHEHPSIDIESIEFTESLAHSKAFEAYLFDHMAQRRATHTMTEKSEPIKLSPGNIQTIIPEEIREIFGDSHATIDRLSVFQEETHDLSFVFMQFYVNDERHTLTSQSDETNSVYTRPNSFGDIASYPLSSDAPLALLAGLVYAREYDTIQAILESRKKARLGHVDDAEVSGDLFSMEGSTIDAPRIGNSDMIERLIMTLGHFDGLSEIKTAGLLPIEDKMLFVSLNRAESPQLGYVSNELDLSILDVKPKQPNEPLFDRLGLSQQLGDIKAFTGEDFNDQLGEMSQNEHTTIIQPEKDLQAWSVLCSQFARTMQHALIPYGHHDKS